MTPQHLLGMIWRSLRRPSAFLKQLRLLAAYSIFRWRYRFLAHPQPVPTQGVALIVNFSDTPHRAITEGIMGGALRREGVEPVIVTSRAYAWLERYARALGITRFAYVEDYQQPSHAAGDAAVIDGFLATHPSVEAILAFRIGQQNIPIGVNALSTVLKRLRQGSVNLDDPAVWDLVRRVLLEAAAAVRTADALLADLQPRLLLFNEAGYTPYGELFAVAVQRGMNAVQYVHSQRLDAFVLKRYKSVEHMVDPVSLSPATWQRVRALPWGPAEEAAFMRDLRGHYENRTWFTLILSQNKRHLSPAVVAERLGLDPTKRTAVVFSHVVWDASFFFGTNLFRDYDEWLLETVRVACTNTHLNWVIKLHPDYVWHTKDLAGDAAMRDMIAMRAGIGSPLPEHIRIVPPATDISTYSFFAVTDYCITVRGTIGLECPCFGIPVYTAGTGRYTGFGFTEDSATREAYLEKLRTLHRTEPLSHEQQSLARKHAWALFTLHVIPCTSFELIPLTEHGDVVDHRTAVYARSLGDLEADPGLRTIATWALHSREEDYLALPQASDNT